MILFPLNTEFDIELKYPYTFNFPIMEIRTKLGDIVSHSSLADTTIKQEFERLLATNKYKDSKFLQSALKQNSI